MQTELEPAGGDVPLTRRSRDRPVCGGRTLHRLLVGLAAALVLGACSGGADPAEQGVLDEASESDDLDGGAETRTDGASAVPDDVAARIVFDDGSPVEILHADLDAILVPTVAAQDFVDAFYFGTPPTELPAVVLTQLIHARSVEAELASRGGEVTAEDETSGADVVLVELARRLDGSPQPLDDARRIWDDVVYVRFLGELLAGRIALARHLEESAGPDDGDPCVRQIVLDTESAAMDARAELDAGAEFVVVAVERSMGSSAARGGDIGCAPPDTYAAEFANAVIGADVGEVVGPFETPFGWHVIVVEGYEVDGSRLATSLLESRWQRATITVDERVGSWNGSEVVSSTADDG